MMHDRIQTRAPHRHGQCGWRWLLCAALLPIVAGGSGCTTTLRVTNTEQTPVQRLLVTEAIDRALDKLIWPELRGKKVLIDEGVSPATGDLSADEVYLYQAIAARLAHRGAVIVPNRGEADSVLLVLVGSLGTGQREQFIGLPSLQILLFGIPEISLYRSLRQQGFAKLEIVLVKTGIGTVMHHSGPVRGETFWRSRQVPFSSSITTDTSRYLKAYPPVGEKGKGK